MQQTPILTLSVLAVAAIAAQTFVGFEGQPAAAGEAALGVADYEAAIGKQTAATVLGTAKVKVGAPIAAGGLIQVGAGGVAIPKAAGKTVARALTATATVGATIEVLLLPASL